MIFITGDCHGEFNRFSMKKFPDQRGMNKNDVVIICGDFGGIRDREEWQSGEEIHWLKWLDDKNFTTVFVDGNHENHERLCKFPEIMWNGGRVHQIRDSVFHLMRGEIYTIEGHTFFAFGGASSHDISDGIIEMDREGNWIKTVKVWRKPGKNFRIKGLEWWEQELPTDEELAYAEQSLKEHDDQADYIITHCCPQHIADDYIERNDEPDILTNFFDAIDRKVEYKKWFFGHYHDEKEIGEKYRLIYKQIVRLL